jgi:Fe-S cluster biogenesis protein NfuA
MGSAAYHPAGGELLKDELNSTLRDIRARIRGHAGDVVVTDVTDGVVTLDFLGACRGCPAQAFTFAAVVEPALRTVDGVKEVTPPRSETPRVVLERIRKLTART